MKALTLITCFSSSPYICESSISTTRYLRNYSVETRNWPKKRAILLEVLFEVGLDDVLLVILPDANYVGDAVAFEEVELRFFGGRVRPQV